MTTWAKSKWRVRYHVFSHRSDGSAWYDVIWHLCSYHLQDLIDTSPHCLPYNYDVTFKNLVSDQPIIPIIDVFFYSHHLSSWYCIDIVRRNSVLVTDGSYRVNYFIEKLQMGWKQRGTSSTYYIVHLILYFMERLFKKLIYYELQKV